MGNTPFAAAIQKERAQSKIAKKRPLKWRAECFQALIRTSSGFETSKRAGAINGGISDRKSLYQEHLLGICFTASRGSGVSPAGKTGLPHLLGRAVGKSPRKPHHCLGVNYFTPLPSRRLIHGNNYQSPKNSTNNTVATATLISVSCRIRRATRNTSRLSPKARGSIAVAKRREAICTNRLETIPLSAIR
jgi:hypothetical protein